MKKIFFISHKKIIGAALADTASTQITADEVDKIVVIPVTLRKYTLLQKCLSVVYLIQVV